MALYARWWQAGIVDDIWQVVGLKDVNRRWHRRVSECRWGAGQALQVPMAPRKGRLGSQSAGSWPPLGG